MENTYVTPHKTEEQILDEIMEEYELREEAHISAMMEIEQLLLECWG